MSRIYLPPQFQGGTMTRLVDAISNGAGSRLPNEVCFDFSRLKFIRPAGACFLSNMAHWLMSRGVRVSFAGCDPSSGPVRYLDDSLFFEQHTGKKLLSDARPRSTTLPLQRIAHASSLMWLEHTFIPWLSRESGLQPGALGEIKVCVAELFNNILDHSQLDHGSAFIQHFPKEKRVTIAVSDFGRGIPETVRRVRAGVSDRDAIVLASQEGFTSKSNARNMGTGLSYLMTVATGLCRGDVTIYSLGGMVKFAAVDGVIRPRALPGTGFCPGTMVEINVSTEFIPDYGDDRGELEWL